MTTISSNQDITGIEDRRPKRIIHTYRGVQGTGETAQRFCILLALEKGYQSEVFERPWGHRVLDERGWAVDFRGTK